MYRSHTYLRSLRAVAVMLTALAIAFVCTAALPQRAYAYSTDPTGAIGKVTGEKYKRTFYGKSVEDVMHIVDDMISTRNNPLHETSVTIELLADWNTKSYGRIKVPSGYTYTIELHGHMLNRDKALSYGSMWYAEGSGEAIYVEGGGVLYVYGASTEDEKTTEHKGYTLDNGYFWDYDGKGDAVIKGGLITGGACDDWHGAGGISLAGNKAHVYVEDTTIAGNLTDQVDSNRYGHGAGIAVHGSNCLLSLKRTTIKYNHAEGYGGGIYVRDTDCGIEIQDGTTISNNQAIKGGGGIYLDSKASISIRESSVDNNKSRDSGGGIYINASDSVVTVTGTADRKSSISGNTAREHGGGFFSGESGVKLLISYAAVDKNYADSDEGGAFYLSGNKPTVNISNSSVSSNRAHIYGAGFYITGNDSNVTVKDSVVSSNYINTYAEGYGGVMYHAGKNGSVTFENTKLENNFVDGTNGKAKGGAIYNKRDGTSFTFKNSTISGSSAFYGGAFYLEDVTTLTLDNSFIKGNKADNFGAACGGGIYAQVSGSKIILKNNSSICENSALSEGDGGTVAEGGGVYSEANITITSPDGTGTIKDNEVQDDSDTYYGGKGGNGGGIWFSGELYLDNVSITGNKAYGEKNKNEGGYGAGVYCANTKYKAIEFANTVKISDNKAYRLGDGAERSEVASNLHLIGTTGQEICSADGDRALTADSRIGVETDVPSSGGRRVTGNQAALSKIKDSYKTVFSSDDTRYSVVTEGNYVYISSVATKHTVTVNTGCYTKSWSAAEGSTITLNNSDWLTYEEDIDDYPNEDRYGSVLNQIDYWTLTDSTGTRTVKVTDGSASFKLGESNVTAVPHVVRPVGAVGLTFQDNVDWNSLEVGTVSGALSYANIRDRAYSQSYTDIDDWSSERWEQIYRLIKGGSGEQEVVENLDNITTDASRLAAGSTIERTKVEEVKAANGYVAAKKVTYQVTLKKSLLGDDLYTYIDSNPSHVSSLMAFEARVENSSLGTKTVEDQSSERRGYTYATSACTEKTNADGDMILTFVVSYDVPSYTITFNTGAGAFADGSTSVTATTGSDGTVTIPTEMPTATQEDYLFGGWYTADGTKVGWYTTFTQDTTITARYSERDHDYQYRFAFFMTPKGEGGSSWEYVTSAELKFVDGGTATIKKPDVELTREGYEFAGWYADQAYTTPFDFTKVYSYDDGSFIMVYAKWTPKSYKVTFNTDGGNPTPAAQTVERLGKVSEPTVKPVRTGFEFVGWTLDGEAYDFDDPVTKDIELKANWKQAATQTWTVTYKLYGDVCQYASVENGQTAAEFTPEARDGFTFAGWYEDENFNTKFNFDTAITKDTSIYAKWNQSVSKHKVTYKLYDDVCQYTSVEDGQTAPELQPGTRESYRFVGWYADEQFKTKFDFSAKITQDTTIYAKWAQQYTVTFSTPEDAEQVSALTVDAGTTIASADLPRATREHYRFRGWNDADGTEVSDLTVNSDVTLTARWRGENLFVWMHNIDDETPYTIKNYGDDLVEEDLWTSVDEHNPVREGYDFAGWYVDEACTEALVLPHAMTEELHIYAKWTPQTRTVNFNSMGGSAVADQIVAYGERAAEPEAPTKAGSVFKGWYTDQACTQVYAFSNAVTENMTLYAKWAQTVTIAFDAAGGEDVEPASVEIERGTTLSNLPVTRRGRSAEEGSSSDEDEYLFAGWYTADGEKVNANTKFNESCTLTAHWIKNTTDIYTVYFYSEGELVDLDLVVDGDKLERPADPERSGYGFIGWYLDEASQQGYDFGEPVTKDLTLYAGWKKMHCRVTFDTGDGTEIEDQYVEWGKTIERPEDPTREGYTFCGWTYNGQNFNFDSPVTGELALTAVWEKKADPEPEPEPQPEPEPEPVSAHTVTFDSFGGTAVEAQQVEDGACATEPAAPTRSGYIFRGWTLNGAAYDFSTPVTSDITLTAKWEREDSGKVDPDSDSDSGADSGKKKLLPGTGDASALAMAASAAAGITAAAAGFTKRRHKN